MAAIVLDRRIVLRCRVPTLGSFDEQGDQLFTVTDTEAWAGLLEEDEEFGVEERGGVKSSEIEYVVRWSASIAAELGRLFIVTASGLELRVDRIREYGGRRRFLRLTTGART